MSSSELGFLRFEVCGQTFAMPMADLAGIRQTVEAGLARPDASSGGDPDTRVAPVNLAELFFGQTGRRDGDFILIVRTGQHMYALCVDTVLAGTDVKPDVRTELPPIVAALGGPLSGMFWDPGGWVLAVDADRLLDVIRHQYAGMAGEFVYDIR